MNIIDERVFNKFKDLFEKSLRRNAVITEDTVRYLFYSAIIVCNGNRRTYEDIILSIQQEISYENNLINFGELCDFINRNTARRCLNELDTYVDFDDNKYAIEFKYQRKMSNNQNKRRIPHSKYYGKMVNDLNRLSIIDSSINRYFAYIIDDSMIDYLANDNGRLYREIINLEINESMPIQQNIINGEIKSVREMAYRSFNDEYINQLNDFTICKMYDESLAINETEYKIMIFKIENM